MDESTSTVTIMSVSARKAWVESDFLGDRHVMVQHEGCEAFEYATFHYDYRYTSNSGTLDAAEKMARSLGATDPIEHRRRDMQFKFPTKNELKEQIAEMQQALDELEKEEGDE